MRFKLRIITTLIVTPSLAIGLNPLVLHATQSTPPVWSSDGSTIDVSSSAHGNQIMAGVEYGAPPAGGGGAQSDCEWSESVPRDASATGPGTVVTKQIGSINYKLYDNTCAVGNPPTTYHWLPQISTEGLAQHAASIVYDNLPAPWGNFAPPAQRGFVNVGTWIWVNWAIWVPVQVTASVITPVGRLSVTATATPKKLIFEPGDGDLGTGPVACSNPGLIWMSQFGDNLGSPCMYTYRHSSATQPNRLFDASVAIQWHVTWTTNFGASGTIGELTLRTSHQMNIREVQALVSH